MYRIGIDTGGTHTDTVLMDEDTGQTWVDKVSSTPDDPAVGVINGLQRLMAVNGIAAEDIAMIVYGTTVMVNRIIEGESTKTALITTRGFKDVLELRRSFRTGSTYDIQWDQPRSVIPRSRRYEVSERIDHRGRVVHALDETELAGVLEDIRRAGVESVAVCLLHSYANSQHELQIERYIEEHAPEIHLSVSSRISPAIGEYERSSTVAIDAMVKPALSSHLLHLEKLIREIGIDCPLKVMQANGGTMSFEAASRAPVRIINSGPVAGVMAAAVVRERHGIEKSISLDTGGTSTDFAIVLESGPIEMLQGEIHDQPIQQSVVEVHPIGAGGGSIGWVDDGGALRVGPRSAGATPGPVCYGKGGTAPTVTDAAVALGYINPDHFLGGRSLLDVDAARRAIREHVADPLGYSIEEAAYGIIQIAISNCLRAARRMTVQRGHDPRELGMIAFGGAGGLLAGFLARELGVRSLIIPRDPGNTSALGLLITDERYDHLRVMRGVLDTFAAADIEAGFAAIAEELFEQLAEESIKPDDTELFRTLDLRYLGQTYELPISSSGEFNDQERDRVIRTFHEAHAQRYGHAAPEDPVELVNVKTYALVRAPKVSEWRIDAAERSESPTPVRTQRAYFQGWHETPFYERASLGFKASIVGPAVVQENLTTIVVLPGQRCVVDESGDLVITD
ncbi:hydantoinase/oxoprolinase family protein (plasmid) [Arthrobacter sp. KN11-1C]|uniref:hydantoinase/oxoprolinase family protein n=1 Tax=Arthrobacter sp. KN11-1C TaxID=3445774 RepID=UPI003F9FE9A6